MITDIFHHALFGGIFAITGIIVTTKFCEHWYHQLIYGISAVLIESTILVIMVG